MAMSFDVTLYEKSFLFTSSMHVNVQLMRIVYYMLTTTLLSNPLISCSRASVAYRLPVLFFSERKIVNHFSMLKSEVSSRVRGSRITHRVQVEGSSELIPL
jgi:hypothetical protein